MDLTEEQEDLIYEIERELNIEYYGDYKRGEFVQRNEAPFTRRISPDIVAICMEHGFSISITYEDEERIEVEFKH